MGLLLFIVFGLVVGLLARAIMPGRQSMGLIGTALLGMVGSLVGGLLGTMISDNEPTRVHAAGLIGSILGAIAVLLIVRAVGRGRPARI